ncbi:MAG: methylated-DNA--[protein]-cysteine S-methyltransferase [Marinoscillum sp.]
MTTQEEINYNRIAEAIEYIQNSFKQQPTLDELAGSASLSSFHFQRLFTEWVGVSPKKFMQYLSLQHAKRVLKTSGSTLFNAAYETGLSGTGRLHDLFVTVEGMTPGVYKNGGKELIITYGYSDTVFGEIIAASTEKGVCYVAFCENKTEGLEGLRLRFPNAQLIQGMSEHHEKISRFFQLDWEQPEVIKLHLSGTPFQLKVWEALLRIPTGHMATYGQIAHHIESPKASRAVGTAIGSNPIALVIPCHRVIQSTGHFGGYMWGSTRKHAILGWEGVKSASC